jgi:hypothetical protein
MPKIIPGHKCRKAMREAENDILASAQALLAHLLETLDQKKELPKGFFGSNLTDLYRFIAEHKVSKVSKKSDEATSALEKWILGQAISEDDGYSKET